MEPSSFWKPLLRKTGANLSCSETFSGGLFTAHSLLPHLVARPAPPLKQALSTVSPEVPTAWALHSPWRGLREKVREEGSLQL